MATATAAEKNRLTKVISTKLSIEDYNLLQQVTNQAYRDGSIKEPTKSEFLRFVVTLVLSGLRNRPEILSILQNQKM